eukprot:4687-Amphidinium_carterae.1
MRKGSKTNECARTPRHGWFLTKLQTHAQLNSCSHLSSQVMAAFDAVVVRVSRDVSGLLLLYIVYISYSACAVPAMGHHIMLECHIMLGALLYLRLWHLGHLESLTNKPSNLCLIWDLFGYHCFRLCGSLVVVQKPA